MNTHNRYLTKKLAELNEKLNELLKEYQTLKESAPPHVELTSAVVNKRLRPLWVNQKHLKGKLTSLRWSLKKRKDLLIIKTTDADKLIQLSKEVSNRFDLL